ncbi:MAG: hypothetical protein VB124_00740 [Burkholderia sp.]
MKAVEMSRLAHTHWGIENQLHWVLDVSWGEDAQQTRSKAATQNLACVRKFTLNHGAHGATAATSNSGDRRESA